MLSALFLRCTTNIIEPFQSVQFRLVFVFVIFFSSCTFWPAIIITTNSSTFPHSPNETLLSKPSLPLPSLSP